MLTKSQTASLVKHLRDIANIMESASAKSENGTAAETKSKRGRKPGAVSDDIRCNAVLSGGDRCKNRATAGEFCGKHLNE